MILQDSIKGVMTENLKDSAAVFTDDVENVSFLVAVFICWQLFTCSFLMVELP